MAEYNMQELNLPNEEGKKNLLSTHKIIRTGGLRSHRR